jgi:hypothetical protein
MVKLSEFRVGILRLDYATEWSLARGNIYQNEIRAVYAGDLLCDAKKLLMPQEYAFVVMRGTVVIPAL